LRAKISLNLNGQVLNSQSAVHFDSGFYKQFESTRVIVPSHLHLTLIMLVCKFTILTRQRGHPLKARNILALTGQGPDLQSAMHFDTWFYKQFDSTGNHTIQHTSVARVIKGVDVRYHFHNPTIVTLSILSPRTTAGAIYLRPSGMSGPVP